MQCSGKGTVWFAKDAMEVHASSSWPATPSRSSPSSCSRCRTTCAPTSRSPGCAARRSGQGLFTTTVTGSGPVALLSAGGPPIALEVSPQYPLVVDPDAFVASQGQLNQTFVTDVSWRNLIGESSGEAFSLRFDGHGVVYIQPEER